MLNDILKSRDVLWLLVRRELKTRYAGSNFGAFWNLIHPVVLVLIYVAIFSQIMAAKLGEGGTRFDYMIHLTSGIIPWLMFSEIVTRSCSVLLENSNLLKKMALPEEVLFLSVFLTSFFVYGISLGALIALLAAAGAPISPLMLAGFPLMAGLGLTGLGLGMVLSVLNLLVRDVGQVVQIGLQLGFWSLPIVYWPSILGDRLQQLIALNPIRGYFSLMQLLFGSPQPMFNPDAYWTIVLLPFLAIVVGLHFLRSHRPEILDAL